MSRIRTLYLGLLAGLLVFSGICEFSNGAAVPVRNSTDFPEGSTTTVGWHAGQSKVVGQKNVHIRSHSISERINRYRNGQKILMRNMRRTLLFRFRMARIHKHEQVLGQRLNRLETRKVALTKQISVAMAKRAKLIRMQAMQSSSNGSANIKGVKRRIPLQLSKCILQIRSLRMELTQLQHRIWRLHKRQRTLRRRIATLSDRVRVQLADSQDRYWSLANSVERWHTYDLRRLARFSRKADPNSSRQPLKITSREDVIRYSEWIYRVMKNAERTARALLISNRNFAYIKGQLANLRSSRNKLPKSRSGTEKLSKEMKPLNAEKIKELIKQKKLHEEFHIIATNFSTLLSRLGLRGFVRMLQHGPKQKVKADGLNDETLKKRIRKRMKHFELQLYQEASRLDLLKSRAIHIRHRRSRLRRRLNRHRKKRRRLERRIDEMEIRAKMLVKRFGEAGKFLNKQMPLSSSVIKNDRNAGAVNVQSLRRQRGRLIRRIRETAAKSRRLVQRATEILCRIRQQKRRLRRLIIRRQRFLRRLRRNGLDKLST